MRRFAWIVAVAFLVQPLVAHGSPANSPVLLSDAQSFESPLASGVTPAEISSERKRLASAVCAEKFMDGVETVVVVGLIVYLAWPSPAASSGGGRFAALRQRWWASAAAGGAGAAP